MKTSEPELRIAGGLCLLPGEGFVPADLVCAGGHIAEVRRSRAGIAGGLDVSGCLVLPGIVDIHGDAFERQIMPRPNAMFPLDIAMLETDRQLAANGITTAYHGVTVSWEPGLRSLDQSLRVIDAVNRLEPHLLVEHLLHIRWETFALDEMVAVKALFGRAKKPLLAFNDHTGPVLTGARAEDKIKKSAERAVISPRSYMSLMERIAARADAVPKAIEAMAAAAREQGIMMLSHDDASPVMRDRFRALGAEIAEFPMNLETRDAAADAGDLIVLGAPNVVRGGSHNGAISAELAVREGKCSVLASDYYYPALLQSALLLRDGHVLPLERAWELISAAPAAACGLTDRGCIAEGLRADLVILPEAGRRPLATLVKGRIVHRSL